MHCSTIDLPEQEKNCKKYIQIEKIKDIKVKFFKKFQRLKSKLNLWDWIKLCNFALSY